MMTSENGSASIPHYPDRMEDEELAREFAELERVARGRVEAARVRALQERCDHEWLPVRSAGTIPPHAWLCPRCGLGRKDDPERDLDWPYP